MNMNMNRMNMNGNKNKYIKIHKNIKIVLRKAKTWSLI